MGLIGMGNNPMVGATVACAVAVEESCQKALVNEADEVNLLGKFVK